MRKVNPKCIFCPTEITTGFRKPKYLDARAYQLIQLICSRKLFFYLKLSQDLVFEVWQPKINRYMSLKYSNIYAKLDIVVSIENNRDRYFLSCVIAQHPAKIKIHHTLPLRSLKATRVHQFLHSISCGHYSATQPISRNGPGALFRAH